MANAWPVVEEKVAAESFAGCGGVLVGVVVADNTAAAIRDYESEESLMLSAKSPFLEPSGMLKSESGSYARVGLRLSMAGI